MTEDNNQMLPAGGTQRRIKHPMAAIAAVSLLGVAVGAGVGVWLEHRRVGLIGEVRQLLLRASVEPQAVVREGSFAGGSISARPTADNEVSVSWAGVPRNHCVRAVVETHEFAHSIEVASAPVKEMSRRHQQLEALDRSTLWNICGAYDSVTINYTVAASSRERPSP